MAYAVDSRFRSVAAINITPLVDVMLVLLVIFMMSAPLLTRAIPLDLPGSTEPQPLPPAPVEPVRLWIDAAGAISWNGEPVQSGDLPARMAAEAALPAARQPMLQVDASADSDYQALATVLAAADRAGLRKVGLVRR